MASRETDWFCGCGHREPCRRNDEIMPVYRDGERQFIRCITCPECGGEMKLGSDPDGNSGED